MFEYTAQVVRILDGDTVDFEVDLGLETYRRMRTRLASINTPELTSRDPAQRALAAQARDFVQAALPLGSTVKIRTFKDKREKYGRYLVMIYAPETETVSINEKLVEAGLAVPYMVETSPPAPNV